MGVIQNIINKEIPGIREVNPAVPEAAEEIVGKALARNRDERFQSAREFREAIEQVLGLEGLSGALSTIPVLLERNTDTRLIPMRSGEMAQSSITKRKSPSSAMARKKSHKPAWITLGVMTAAAAAVAGYIFLGPGTIPDLSAFTPNRAPIQQSTLGDEWNTDVFGTAVDTTAKAGPIDAAVHVRVDTVLVPVPAKPVAETARPKATPAMPWVDPAAQSPTAQSSEPAPVETDPVESAPVETPAKPVEKKPAPQQEPERFREGYLLVNVEPSAQVYVNGVYRGLANPTLRLTLNAGMQSIECRSDKFQTYNESLRITAGETSSRTVLMKKLRGIISLATQEGAELYVDGALIGITPIMRPIEVDAGTHTLTIKKLNHFTWSSDVTVEPNATLPLRITLSPRY
jgi:hypothetical protein